MYFYCAMSKLEIEYCSSKLGWVQRIRYERSLEKKSTRVLSCALKM